MSVPLEPMSLHRGVAIGGSVPLRWFPGLHSVPLEIRSPTKAAVVGFLDLLRHGHTLLSELSEGAFEVMDSVIHLRRGMAGPPLPILFCQDGPYGMAYQLTRARADPLEYGDVVLDRNPEVNSVPVGQFLRVAGP